MTPYRIRESLRRFDLGTRSGKSAFWRECIFGLDGSRGARKWGFRYQELATEFRTGGVTGHTMDVRSANEQAALQLADELEYELGESEEYYPDA